MYARITPYKMKSGSRDAAVKVMEGVKDQILALPGMVHFYNVMDGDCAGYIVSLTTEAEVTEEMTAKVQKIWAHFGQFLEAKPQAASYEVIADWTA